jgi:hypothetical protein
MRRLVVPRKYTGNSDGVAKNGKAREGVEELFRICKKNYGFTNLGMFSNRRMNNDKAKADPNNPKWLSVHATGRAVDMGYRDRKKALECWNFLIANTAELGIEEIHDYSYRNPKQDPKDKTAWGAGYRCSRGENLRGIKLFTSKDNAGTPNGKWLHVELSPQMADNAKAFRDAWIACKNKPS